MSTTTQYTGEKYVPVVADPVEWDVNREYEHLIIVMHDGDSYISKQDVPKGAQITNTRYWLKTNNFSAQLDQTIKKANSGIEKADEALGKFPVSIPNGGTGATTAANARSNLGLGNVENKSSATIRNELTKANVTSALGYTPSSSDNNTTYSLSQDSSDGHKLTFTGSDGTSKIVTIPDNDTKALENMTGTLSVSHGGTNAATAADARTNLGLGNVENKSSATIRGELTKANVTSALGYTPSASNTDTTYSFSQDSNDGHKLTLTGSDGTSKTITVPDNDTKALGSMTGTLSISHGGTGKTTATDAWTALGGGSIGKKNSLAASDIPNLSTDKLTSGTLPIGRGGTGKTTAADAWTALGGGSIGKKNSLAASDIPSLDASKIGSGALPISHGGTGATNAANAFKNLSGYTLDTGTNNTTDTWVPVFNGSTIQHRVIPTNLATTPTSLWSGNSNGNITLSQSAANFTRITIYFHDNDDLSSSVDVYDPNGKRVLLTTNWKGQYIKMRCVTISGTSISTQYSGEAATVNNTSTDTNRISITRVLGWKY